MKWFIDRTLTGIAHLLSSQPGTPEMYNLIALVLTVGFLVFESLHWDTFNGRDYVWDCGIIMGWWGGARVIGTITQNTDKGRPE